ncbi:acyl-CoA dehydrogenase [Rhodothalassium salexigens]|uniref:acyl-CoA dehydrogenase family protein n=1 Tax=Rhodothalassium salexigens TaxID=1086 RepID=UPI00191402C3|nr:acyl-CoA dehydrogenase family protein [Rhodothalassium salexigens]MBK5922080.1 acyl-CoA dehydrogenase [Rhodothalassium salexigens]
MDFALSEEQRLIVDTARAFAAEHMAPHAARWDADKLFPKDALRAAADLGFAAVYVDADKGGVGLSRTDCALIMEQLAYACPSTAAYLSIHNMAAWMVAEYGTPETVARLVPDLASMARFASYCLTEPGAGSDAASLKTRAERDGDAYVLNGAKAFISGAGPDGSDVYVVMARTGAGGPKGITAFVVDKDTPGVSFGAQERKLGWHSQPTAQVNFDDCRVPVENRLGAEGQGFAIAMAGLDGGRLNIGACSLGGGQFALDTALAYARERRQFGQAIADFQATQFKLADMATELEAARLLLYKAADKVSHKAADATAFAAMAKRLATDTGFKVANEALQLHGGYGYLMDYPIERVVRDLRVHQILEGTNEIMRVIVAKRLLG